MSIESYEFELICTTPLFMGSVEAEAWHPRGQGLRGLLRFWFRAAAPAGVKLAELATIEQAVFGSAEHPSRFKAWIDVSGDAQGCCYTKREPPEIQYLLFSMQENRDRHARWFVPTGRPLKAGLRFVCLPEAEASLLKVPSSDGARRLQDARQRLVQACLWLLARLGGLGSRWRRGIGSVEPAAGSKAWSALENAIGCGHCASDTGQALKAVLGRIDLDYRSMLELVKPISKRSENSMKVGDTKASKKGESSKQRDELPGHSRLTKDLAEVYEVALAAQPKDSNAALFWIGQTLKQARRLLKDTHDSAAINAALAGRDDKTKSKGLSLVHLERTIFGLPLNDERVGFERSPVRSRSSSPLVFQVKTRPDGSRRVLVIWFEKSILPGEPAGLTELGGNLQIWPPQPKAVFKKVLGTFNPSAKQVYP